MLAQATLLYNIKLSVCMYDTFVLAESDLGFHF
jgi:hypothetical protein